MNFLQVRGGYIGCCFGRSYFVLRQIHPGGLKQVSWPVTWSHKPCSLGFIWAETSERECELSAASCALPSIPRIFSATYSPLSVVLCLFAVDPGQASRQCLYDSKYRQ